MEVLEENAAFLRVLNRDIILEVDAEKLFMHTLSVQSPRLWRNGVLELNPGASTLAPGFTDDSTGMVGK